MNPRTPAKIVVANDPFLWDLVSNKKVRAAFPAIEEIALTAKKKSGTSCASCDASRIDNSAVERIKAFLMNMPGPTAEKFKETLGYPPLTTIRMFRRVQGTRIERIDV